QVDGVVVVARTNRPSRVGHDATRHRLSESEGRTRGDDSLAYGELAGLRESGRVQVAYAVNFDHCQVIGFRGANDLGRSRRAVVESDGNFASLGGASDHMVVGQDVPVLVEHHAATDSAAAT